MSISEKEQLKSGYKTNVYIFRTYFCPKMAWYTSMARTIRPLYEKPVRGLAALALLGALTIGTVGCCGSNTTGHSDGDIDCEGIECTYDGDAAVIDSGEGDVDCTGCGDGDGGTDGDGGEDPLPPDPIDDAELQPESDSQIILGTDLNYGLIVPPSTGDLVCRVNIMGPGVDKLLREGPCNPGEFFGGTEPITHPEYQPGDHTLDIIVENDNGAVDAQRLFDVVGNVAPIIDHLHHQFAHVGGSYYAEFIVSGITPESTFSISAINPPDFNTNNETPIVEIDEGYLGTGDLLSQYGYVAYTLHACNGELCGNKDIRIWINNSLENINLLLEDSSYLFQAPNNITDYLFHGNSELGLEDCETNRVPSYNPEGLPNLILEPEETEETVITDPEEIACIYLNLIQLGTTPQMLELVERSSPGSYSGWESSLTPSSILEIRNSRLGPN